MRFIFCNILICVVLFSCKKDTNRSIVENSLSFSVDTLLFDTVFTNVGSATRYLKVYNNSDVDLNLNSVRLGKGTTSSFRVNIDGEPHHNIQNTLIRSGDSLYIFADVTIDPNSINNPFVETDSILFQYDNYSQHVKLRAWGRNAHYYSAFPDYQQYEPYESNQDIISICEFFNCYDPNFPAENINDSLYCYSVDQNTTWDNDKPHVIYGSLIVRDQAQLNINEGAEVYLHNNSSIIILNGNINAEGSLGNEITFQSDRSDSHSITNYDQTPGQWGGIWILPGNTGNKMDYVKMKNGQIGIEVTGLPELEPSATSLTITNSIIYNMSNIGMWATNSQVYGANLLMVNCGQYLLTLYQGGDYDFKHCTFVNPYPAFGRQNPSIYITNYHENENQTHYSTDLKKASFGNCIIDGHLENEILLAKQNDAEFEYFFDHCVVKVSEDFLNEMEVNFEIDWDNNTNSIIRLNNNENCGISNFNQNDLTMSKLDFYLANQSVAIGSGSVDIASQEPIDMDGINRVFSPDIGCFEKH